MTITVTRTEKGRIFRLGDNAAAAVRAAERAEVAASAASAAGNYFPDLASGEAGTVEGDFFSYPDDVGGINYAERDAVGSHIVGTSATLAAVDAKVAIADLASTDAGKGAARVGAEGGGTVQAGLEARRKIVSDFISAKTVAPVTNSGPIETSGYAAANDRGRTHFIISATEPAHPFKFQDAEGNWREAHFDGRVQAMAAGLASGSGDKTGKWNDLIAYINAKGSAARSAYKMLGIDFSNIDEVDLRAGGINPLLISNVAVFAGRDTRLRMEGGPAFKLGQTGTLCENFSISGFTPTMDVGATPSADCALIEAVHAARIFMQGIQPYNMPKLLYGDIAATNYLTTIYAENIYGLGHPDFSWFDITTATGAAAAGLRLRNVNGYPYAPPANPAIVPKAITAITQANPGVVTCAGHGFTTGARIRLGDAGGMTEVNGVDFTITVIDANSFSIGVDTTAYTAYTSGGWAVELHWAWNHDAAMLKIEGHWDTLTMEDMIIQHWARMYDLHATNGTISFVEDRNNFADYIGNNRCRTELNGNTISHWNITGGWTFTLNGSFFDRIHVGGGVYHNCRISGHTVGLVGGDFFNDTTGRIPSITIDDVIISAIGRTRSGSSYGVRAGGPNSRYTISSVRCLNPDTSYGAGASTYLSPDYGIQIEAAPTDAKVIGCDIKANTKNYNMITPTVTGRTRHFDGNTRLDGDLPEYAALITPTVTTGTFDWRNRTGIQYYAVLSGGTISAMGTSYIDGTDTEVLSTSAFTTTGPLPLGRDQNLRIVNSVAPTLRLFPVL